MKRSESFYYSWDVELRDDTNRLQMLEKTHKWKLIFNRELWIYWNKKRVIHGDNKSWDLIFNDETISTMHAAGQRSELQFWPLTMGISVLQEFTKHEKVRGNDKCKMFMQYACLQYATENVIEQRIDKRSRIIRCKYLLLRADFSILKASVCRTTLRISFSRGDISLSPLARIADWHMLVPLAHSPHGGLQFALDSWTHCKDYEQFIV